nr:nuclear cap-binding protein subunit 3-like [Anolis sagrei ordinatus]
MAAVRGLRVSLKGPASSEPEPMEVEEGELLLPPPKEREEEPEEEEEEEGEEEEEEEEEQKPPPPPPLEEEEEEEEGGGEASGSLRRALPDTSRRYENKAGSFITGIDVTSKEAIEKKEQRAKRFHFRAEVNLAQRNVALDRDTMKKAIPKLRLDTLYVFGVDEMSTQDIFGYFKEYPPAHIEWLDDTSCNVVWLDEVTATRALINMSSMPEEEEDDEEKAKSQESGRRGRKEKAEGSSEDEAEEGEVEDDHHSQAEELDTLSQAEEDSLLRNDLRPAVKLAKGNKLFMRFATRGEKWAGWSSARAALRVHFLHEAEKGKKPKRKRSNSPEPLGATSSMQSTNEDGDDEDDEEDAAESEDIQTTE